MAQLLKWTEVESSNVQGAAYHEGSHTLCVRFHNGGLYTYENVDQEVFVSLVHAESVGKYLNQVVKGTYSYTKWDNEQELLKGLESRKR